MTDPFETQVAEALESLLLRQQGEDSPDPETWDSGYAAHLANYLAPRIAAAIDAAAGPKYPVGPRTGALAAVRGTPQP